MIGDDVDVKLDFGLCMGRGLGCFVYVVCVTLSGFG